VFAFTISTLLYRYGELPTIGGELTSCTVALVAGDAAGLNAEQALFLAAKLVNTTWMLLGKEEDFVCFVLSQLSTCKRTNLVSAHALYTLPAYSTMSTVPL
jgi:hypothetical protein